MPFKVTTDDLSEIYQTLYERCLKEMTNNIELRINTCDIKERVKIKHEVEEFLEEINKILRQFKNKSLFLELVHHKGKKFENVLSKFRVFKETKPL